VRQAEQTEFRRRQEFVADRLLQLVDEVGTYVAHVHGPPAVETTTRMRALVQVLPGAYATTIKRWLRVELDPLHVNIWRRYAPEGQAEDWTTPDFMWVQAELADNIRDAMNVRP
jgi:hypothetical protein